MLLRSQDGLPPVSGESPCFLHQDHTALQPRCQAPAPVAPVGALALELACLLWALARPAPSGWTRVSKWPVDLGYPVLSNVLSGAQRLPAVHTGLPPGEARSPRPSTKVKVPGLSSTLSTFKTPPEPSRALHLPRLQAPGGVSPARLSSGPQLPSGRPHACIVSVSHSKDTRTRDGGEGKGLGSQPRGPSRPPGGSGAEGLPWRGTCWRSLWTSLTQHSQQGTPRWAQAMRQQASSS